MLSKHSHSVKTSPLSVPFPAPRVFTSSTPPPIHNPPFFYVNQANFLHDRALWSHHSFLFLKSLLSVVPLSCGRLTPRFSGYNRLAAFSLSPSHIQATVMASVSSHELWMEPPVRRVATPGEKHRRGNQPLNLMTVLEIPCRDNGTSRWENHRSLLGSPGRLTRGRCVVWLFTLMAEIHLSSLCSPILDLFGVSPPLLPNMHGANLTWPHKMIQSDPCWAEMQQLSRQNWDSLSLCTYCHLTFEKKKCFLFVSHAAFSSFQNSSNSICCVNDQSCSHFPSFRWWFKSNVMVTSSYCSATHNLFITCNHFILF